MAWTEIKQNITTHQPMQQDSNWWQAQLNPLYTLSSKLNDTIDSLDVKIGEIIKSHQAEFLFAYRNHIRKMKEQLAEIRAKTDEQEKKMQSDDHRTFLQKQLALFRDQALKLYDKLGSKDREAEIDRARAKQSIAIAGLRENECKVLLKKVKTMEAQQIMDQEQIKELKSKVEQLRLKDIQNGKKINAALIRKRITSSLPTESNQKAAKTTEIKQNYGFTKSQLNTNQLGHSELSEVFLECLNSIRKEVAQRKNYYSPRFDMENIGSFDEFRMIDKLRLLEAFLQNEKLLVWMYSKIFPNRLDELAHFFKAESAPSESPVGNSQSAFVVNRVDDHAHISSKRKNSVRNRVMIRNGKLSISSIQN